MPCFIKIKIGIKTFIIFLRVTIPMNHWIRDMYGFYRMINGLENPGFSRKIRTSKSNGKIVKMKSAEPGNNVIALLLTAD